MAISIFLPGFLLLSLLTSRQKTSSPAIYCSSSKASLWRFTKDEILQDVFISAQPKRGSISSLRWRRKLKRERQIILRMRRNLRHLRMNRWVKAKSIDQIRWNRELSKSLFSDLSVKYKSPVANSQLISQPARRILILRTQTARRRARRSGRKIAPTAGVRGRG